MNTRSFRKAFIASLLLVLPLFLIPALCFVLNRASFVWSLVVIGLTGWRWHRTGRDPVESETPAKGALFQLVLATFVLQMLAFAWIGAVWMLQGIGQWIMLSLVASRIVAWIQAQWFAELAAWSVLFAVVCVLFRLGRPLLAWHRRAVYRLVTTLSERDSPRPTALPCRDCINDSAH